MRRRRKKQDGRWNALWIMGFLAAFGPNCSRCCPDGPTSASGCSCKYAWEDCPTPKGCDTCSTRATTSSSSTGVFEAGTQADPVAPDVVANPPGGTITFVPSPTGAFVVSSIPALDRVHVVHLEATKWDEDPLTIRTIGDVALEHGDEPGRVVASKSGNAHTILRRGGALVAIDPAKTPLSIERTRICAEPRGLAYDAANDLLHVACTSGEIVTLSAALQQEVKHRFVSSGLEEIAVGPDMLVATTRSRILRIASDGSIDGHEARGAIGAVRTTSSDVAFAFTNGNASFATMTNEGTLGPFMAVRPTARATSDLDVAPDATVAIVSDGDAFVLARGAAAFEPIGQPGIARAIALGEIATDGVKRRVIAVQTDAPRMVVFFDLLHPTVMLGFETL